MQQGTIIYRKENYDNLGTDMLVPVVVVNHLSSEAASRIDACASDGDGGQMNHEDCKTNG